MSKAMNPYNMLAWEMNGERIPNLPGGHVWSPGDTLFLQFWHRDNIPQPVTNMTEAISVQLQ